MDSSLLPRASDGGGNRTIGLFPDQSSLIGLLLVHGWFLLVFGLYLGYCIWKTTANRLLLGSAVGIPVLAGIVSQVPAIILVAPLLVVAWLPLRTEATVGFESVLFLAGAGLVLLVEFVYLDAQAAPGRMNTVFKIYMQVWVLWGVGAAVAVERLLPGRPSRWSIGEWRQPAFAVLGIVLLLTVSMYGIVALGNHFGGTTDPTLDATRWAQEQHPDEWEAIQFIASKPGQPNIVTTPACWCNNVEQVRPYRWANAPSSFTGIPTVAGWLHQVGYRGREPYRQRVEDVRTIYTGSREQRINLLNQYNVRYIYVGPNERALYDPVDFADNPAITIVFQNDAVTIYRVNQDGLSSSV